MCLFSRKVQREVSMKYLQEKQNKICFETIMSFQNSLSNFAKKKIGDS